MTFLIAHWPWIVLAVLALAIFCATCVGKKALRGEFRCRRCGEVGGKDCGCPPEDVA